MSGVAYVIERGVVPVILLGFLAIAFVLPGRLPVERRTAGYAGTWLGVVMCLLYVLVYLRLRPILTNPDTRSHAGWVYGVAIGLALGFGIPLVYRKAGKRFRPVIFTAVSGTATISAVNLLPPAPFRELSVCGAPCALFGCLVLAALKQPRRRERKTHTGEIRAGETS